MASSNSGTVCSVNVRYFLFKTFITYIEGDEFEGGWDVCNILQLKPEICRTDSEIVWGAWAMSKEKGLETNLVVCLVS